MSGICVFCASSERIHPTHLDLARRVGAEIARRGHDLVSGGGRVSTTGAVAGDMRRRKGLMDDAADAFLALPGGLGTLEELLQVWVAASLGLHAKPVVVLDPAGVLAGLAALVDERVAQGFVRPAAAASAVWVTTATEALDAVEPGMLGGRPTLRARDVTEELLEGEG
ncbi:MAG TPA: LOG family protein [Kineosporiaceae bacterium]